jgi:YebC/PmpR family DNA-binding regulatory protein
MAGHSKWANIRFRKAAQDNKRGKIFTKLIREITVAARMGGDDFDANPRLRDAVDKALKANMKRDTVNNAIKRGAGGLEGDNMDELRYEGYGPGSVAILVDCLTDNKNRTVAEVRHAFSKHGGNLGATGSVAFQFKKRGELYFNDLSLEDTLFETAIELGADDVINDGDSILIETSPESFMVVKDGLLKAGFESNEAQINFEAENKVELDAEAAEKLMKLVDALEDCDDVQNVYTNADISDEILESLG